MLIPRGEYRRKLLPSPMHRDILIVWIFIDIRPRDRGHWRLDSNVEFRMAAIPTPEQRARAILEIFVLRFGLRPNEVLPRKYF